MAVGRFGRPHGVRGEIRLDPMGTMPRGLEGYDAFYAVGPDGPAQRLEISGWRSTNDALLVTVASLGDRDAVSRLTGRTLYVPRDQMPTPAEDEYYHVDLLGALLVDQAGAELGRVEDVKPWGDYDMLFVKARAVSWMLPLVGEYVRRIDPEKGIIVVDLPEGLGP